MANNSQHHLISLHDHDHDHEMDDVHVHDLNDLNDDDLLQQVDQELQVMTYSNSNKSIKSTAQSTSEELQFKDIAHSSHSYRKNSLDDEFSSEDSQFLLKPGVQAFEVSRGDPYGPSSSAAANDANSSYFAFATLDFYRRFFDVNTSQILSRLARTFQPWKPFYHEEDSKPDLYGPFWIATTLIFVVAVAGNFASFIHFLPDSTKPVWRYDMQKLTTAASMFYGAITVLPLLTWLLIQRGVASHVNSMGISAGGQHPSSISFVLCMSLYGYSLTSYVPVSLLCIVPSELFRWLIIFLAVGFGMCFLYMNLKAYLPADALKPYGYITLGLLCISHVGLGFAQKIYFFEY